MHENIHAPSLFGRHIVCAFETFYGAAKLSTEVGTIKMLDCINTGLTILHGVPGSLDIIPNGCNKAESSNHYSSATQFFDLLIKKK